MKDYKKLVQSVIAGVGGFFSLVILLGMHWAVTPILQKTGSGRL